MSDSTTADSRIVYCRQLDPDTALHMSVFGDDYVFRRFDGSDPFDVSDNPTYSGMRVCYRFDYDRALTPEESRHEVEDFGYWSKRIAEVNAELLPDAASHSESGS
jgi:hypothetical protein